MNIIMDQIIRKYRDDLIEAVKEMETIDGWTDTYDVDRILMNMLTDMRLETIDNVFNKLYTDYVISGKTEFTFNSDQFKIGSFCVSKCMYINKFADYLNVGKLGNKEWIFTIGCHHLWFDDIKDFARYYNLQDRLSFPLDKTTAECMENHLIHLSNGKTIKGAGTINV